MVLGWKIAASSRLLGAQKIPQQQIQIPNTANTNTKHNKYNKYRRIEQKLVVSKGRAYDGGSTNKWPPPGKEAKKYWKC